MVTTTTIGGGGNHNNGNGDSDNDSDSDNNSNGGIVESINNGADTGTRKRNRKKCRIDEINA